MASSFHFSLLLFSLLFLSPCLAWTSFHPKRLILPVRKDTFTLQYITQLDQRTPLVSIHLTLDLGGQFLWVDCDQGYCSTTYRPSRCGSASCSLSESQGCVTECSSALRPRCNNNTCLLSPYNPVIGSITGGELGSDVVSVQSTDGKNPGRVVSTPQLLFVCSSTFLLEGLAGGVMGMAGFGRTKVSLPAQFSAAFSFPRKFALCLSPSGHEGIIFFGNGPYMLVPDIDASTSLIYTPLIVNPVTIYPGTYFQGEASSDYFIGVKSIKINEKTVPNINASLLSIHQGNGGTKISTVNPYTVLETSIYKAVTKFFIKELSGVPRVAAVAPFGVCFNSENIGSTLVGPAVPSIDLVLQSESVYWRIFGANSMVEVTHEVMCLGFVDGGLNPGPGPSIVIGGYQIEDNLLQFDLGASRLGFSSSLLSRQTTCAYFNYTYNPSIALNPE